MPTEAPWEAIRWCRGTWLFCALLNVSAAVFCIWGTRGSVFGDLVASLNFGQATWMVGRRWQGIRYTRQYLASMEMMKRILQEEEMSTERDNAIAECDRCLQDHREDAQWF